MAKVNSSNRSTNNHKLPPTSTDKEKKNDALRQKGVSPLNARTSWTQVLSQGFGVLVIASATYYALTSLFSKRAICILASSWTRREQAAVEWT